MLDGLFVTACIGIVVFGIYKLFDLFVGKKERMMLIEKMSPEALQNARSWLYGRRPVTFMVLRLSLLLLGLGVGFMVGLHVMMNILPEYYMQVHDLNVRGIGSLVYTSCALVGGGLGLLIAFLIEQLCKPKD